MAPVSGGRVRRGIRRVAAAPLDTSGAAVNAARSISQRLVRASQSLPPGVRDQVGQSAKRLRSVRSFKDGKAALTEEAERLFLSATPLLVAAPLPLRGWSARLAAGSAAGAGAVVEQAEELADVVSWGGALPSAPIAAAAVIGAWVLQMWIAASARVNQLRAAGRQVDTDLLRDELARAYLGASAAARRNGVGSLARAVAVRAVEQWLAGLVPGVGVVFDAYTAERTVGRILREPVTAHPPQAPGEALPGQRRG